MDEQQMAARIEELERKVEWLYRATGHGSSYGPIGMDAQFGAGGVSAAVLDLVRQGNKIGAIKQYREENNVGLREAKDAIDALG